MLKIMETSQLRTGMVLTFRKNNTLVDATVFMNAVLSSNNDGVHYGNAVISDEIYFVLEFTEQEQEILFGELITPLSVMRVSVPRNLKDTVLGESKELLTLWERDDLELVTESYSAEELEEEAATF